jgi:hypothetical protein
LFHGLDYTFLFSHLHFEAGKKADAYGWKV